jgi:hypothetical protein
MNTLSLTFWNIEGLPKKVDERNSFAGLFNSCVNGYDFIGLVESWYDDDDPRCDFVNTCLPGYAKPLCIGRGNIRSAVRGGVMFYYRNEYKGKVSLVKGHHGDQLWIRIDKTCFSLANDLYVGIVYISPENSSIWNTRDIDPFAILENDIMNFITKGDVIIGGDFNARIGTKPGILQHCEINRDDPYDHMPVDETLHVNSQIPQYRNAKDRCVNAYGKSLENVCISSNMCVLNGRTIGDLDGRPTCFRYNGCSTVDYVIVSPTLYKDVLSFRVQPLSFLSDHCQLCVTLKIAKHPLPKQSKSKSSTTVPQSKPNNTYKYVWNSASETNFISVIDTAEVRQACCEYLMHSIDGTLSGIDLAVSSLTGIIDLVSSKSLRRVKTAPKKRRKRVWFDSDCKSLKTDMDRARREFVNNPYDGTVRHSYFAHKKAYKRTLKYKQKKQKRDILDQLESLQHEDPGTYWKLLKSLLPAKNREDTSIPHEEWISHFSNIGNTVYANDDFHHEIEHHVNQRNFGLACDDDTVFNRTISSQELRHAVGNLKINKSSGPDLILNEMIKCCSQSHLIDPLLRLFNCILESGHFPTAWRVAHMVPIHKKGDTQDVNNYRGIALSSCLSKVFISILNARLSSYLEVTNKLDGAQNGFRKDHRTSDNIYILNTLIQKHKHEKRKLYACFVDLSKAFDNVWRHGLLYKMAEIGIQGKVFEIIRSMYENTEYSIKTNSGASRNFSLDIGVKQGCVLSPLLFNIYVNDMKDYFEPDACSPPTLDGIQVTHLLHADDLIMFSTSASGIKKSLDSLDTFCRHWKLDINEAKTKIVVFEPQISSSTANAKFTFRGRIIAIVDQYTYLGIDFF